MRKCIMVKVGGNTHKVCKKLVNFLKTEREILKSREEIIIFANQRENVLKTGKIGGKFEICGRRKFCREKVTFLKFSTVFKFVENWGKSLKQGGNASWPQGDGRL